MDDAIYLDHNATTPLLPEVAEAMRAVAAGVPLNPASQHAAGRQARRRLESARDRLGELLGAGPGDRVLLTSGGTEANNLALFGLIGGRDAPPGHLVISAIEHPSVTAAAEHLARSGWQVDYLGVDAQGRARVDQAADLLRPDTRLVSVMLANNETGVIQPVAEIAEICRARGIPLHTDAAQMVGKLPVDFRQLGATALSAAAHKFHGPLGAGLLLVTADAPLVPDLYGGFQQGGARPGTESVALAVGMCRALEAWHSEAEARIERWQALRDRFEAEIKAGWPAAVVSGREADRLPHVSNIGFVGHDRQALFMALDQAGVACSTGAACASGSSDHSPVLVAMGTPADVARGALRFSFGATTTGEEIDEAIRRILDICQAAERRRRA